MYNLKRKLVILLIMIIIMSSRSNVALSTSCWICLDARMDRNTGIIYCMQSGPDACCAQIECL